MIDAILPDYCYSSRPLKPEGVVIHYFSAINVDPENAFSVKACRYLFLDLNLPRDERQQYMHSSRWPENRMYASAHLLIARFGGVWKLIDYDHQAYHAGESVMNGRKNCNRWTLGIELIGTRESGFRAEQYRSLARVLADLEQEFGIDHANVQGHDTVRWEAIQAGSTKPVKHDPSGAHDGQGTNFDWPRLHKLWEDETACRRPIADRSPPEPGQ